MFRFLTTGIGILMVAGTAMAAERPTWEKPLQDQLMRQEQCQLNYLTGLKTLTQPSHKSIEAKAHCIDGRAFDIDNRENPEKFQIHSCGPAVC